MSEDFEGDCSVYGQDTFLKITVSLSTQTVKNCVRCRCGGVEGGGGRGQGGVVGLTCNSLQCKCSGSILSRGRKQHS